ncbi:MFS transporter [Caldinitratiruptor microaerophilus]|uniref:MFS transporter n=1 Tax=Caldinitratiruptor microaerophilus TaxID=671077 RepID=A0AA35CNT3_9FIRM|nr:MFS transporter [Caldinitratiruptor microaerophilus]BDG60776.1 MFS transporter [Caldinitratiruptor microaerophilus]
MRETPAPGDPAARRPAGAGEKWFVLGVVGVGTFMSALDGSVVNIAIPLIQRHYGATIGDVSWVVTAYLLAISSLLLAFGRLGDMWGYKGVYSAGYAVFGAGSLLSGLAPDLGALVAARALQGVGASMLMAIAPALIATSFPAAERGRALGLQATLTYAGLTVGPSLGGWIAGRFGWHWVFLVGVPVSAAGGLLALAVLKDGGRRVRQRFDLPGAGLLAAGLTAILLALSRGETWGWRSPAVTVLLAGGGLLLALFVVQERRAADPMMPLWLLGRPAFAGGVAAAYLQYTVVFMLTFLLPFYLQGLRGLSPQQAGAVMTAQPVAMVAVAAASGWLSDRVGSRLPATAGMAALGAGLWLMARAGIQTSPGDLMARLGLVGLGSGLFTAPNNSAILGAAPRDRQGVASGLLAAARNVGMVTGVALAGSLFAFLRGRLLAAGADPGGAFLAAFRATVLVAVGLAAAGALLSLLRPDTEGDGRRGEARG